jgi:sirohydrochlorin cobaltochelatase
MTKTGVMICGHGSRDVDAIAQFDAMVERLRARLPGQPIERGFLEFAKPVIRDGLDALKAQGCRRIAALPGMLFAAGHVKNDLPWEINSFAKDHPDLEVRMGTELAISPRLIQAAGERIAAVAPGDRQDALLMVVGRGTNDPDANSNVAKVTRMLWEGMGFGWAETSYSGVAYPLVDQGLERAARLGFARIVVFPYFLFTGILVKRIYAWTDAAAAKHPGVQFLKADYLNDHPLVLDTLVERIGEAIEGSGVMNCQLCKYRERILGYEAQQGAVQTGHHHHVRGIGTDADQAQDQHTHDHHTHDHDHDHDHGHGHGHEHGHRHHRHG